MGQRILVTGGRAPATLELCRMLQRQGHAVWLAESLSATITSFSASLSGRIALPSPVGHFEQFVQKMSDAVQKMYIDVIVPTCEEVFHIGRAHSRLRQHCTIFAPSIESLQLVHSKYRFIVWATGLGIPAPETHVVRRAVDVGEWFGDGAFDGGTWVLKPEFSRFGTQVTMDPTRDQLERILRRASGAYVLQRRILGDQVSTWSTFRKGQMTAFCAYPIGHRAGVGAAIWFKSEAALDLEQQVREMGAALNWTGNIAFDFIRDEAGKSHVIECNPRLTSGIHLFVDQPELAAVFTGAGDAIYRPRPGRARQLSLPMVLYGLYPALRHGRGRAWWSDWLAASDVIWSRRDPLPFLGQGVALGRLALRAVGRRTDLLSASTIDIAWPPPSREKEI